MIQSAANTAAKTLRHRTGFPVFIAPRTEKRVIDREMTASARHIRPDNSLNHPAANLSDRRKAITAFLPAQSSVVRDLGPKPQGSSSFRGRVTNSWSPRATSTVRSGANS